MGQTISKNISRELYQSWSKELRSTGNKVQISGEFDLVDLLHQKARTTDTCCILNSNYATAHKDQQILAAFGVKDQLTLPESDKAFEQLKEFCERHKNDWKFGYFSYDLKNDVEELKSENTDQIGFPSLHFFVPEEIVFSDGESCTSLGGSVDSLLTQGMEEINSMGERPVIDMKSFPDQETYLSKVEALKKEIKHGNIYEINFCRDFRGKSKIDPYVTNEQLYRHSPAPFSSFYKLGQRYLIGASPERFIEKNGHSLRVQPIKGTKRRVRDAAEDDRLIEELLSDQKERAENVMIVDLMRNDLSKTAEKGSVEVEELFGVYTFPHVHQLISSITSKLREEIHYIDAIKNCFPMGSMTGAPKLRAMKLIEQYEEFKRGMFSGSVGFISPEENFDFNVVIRSILYNAETEALSIPTGSAITDLSSPQKEWDECVLKAESMISCLRR